MKAQDLTVGALYELIKGVNARYLGEGEFASMATLVFEPHGNTGPFFLKPGSLFGFDDKEEVIALFSDIVALTEMKGVSEDEN